MATYLEKKIEKALEQAEGNHMQAAIFLQQWAAEDELLYAGLTQPFLSSAAIFAIQRYLSQERQKRMKSVPSQRKAGQISDDDLSKLVTQMANNPASATAKQTDSFWDSVPATKPQPGSSQHQAAMEEIAGAFTKPKKP